MATLTTSYQKLGTISTSTYSQLRIYGKYNSQSTANNTTSISIQLRLYGNGGQGSFSSGSCGISGIYNPTSGTTSYSTNLGSTSYSKGSEKTLATYTYSVNHRDDGTYSDTITYRVSSTGSVSGSGSVNFSLPTIPRASQPSASPNPVDVGSATLISFNRASTSFTHDLSIVFGSISETLSTGITADQIMLNIPSTFYNEFTSTERQKNATLTCVTKSGSSTIGTKTLTLGIRIPDSSKPTYTTPTKSETDASVISAIGSSMNKAVINLSKPRYQMTLASQNGATLTSATIKCGDLSNTINLSGTSYNLDYTFTNAMTSNVVQIIITDSRGLQTTYTDTYSNYETYTKPTITYQKIARSGLAGDVRIQLNGTLQATTIGGGTTNNISSSFRYKENASGSSWSSSTDLTSSISYNGNHNEWYLDVTETGIASYDKSWIFEITLADSSTPNTPIVRTYTINRAVPTMSLGENDMQVNGDISASRNLTISGTAQIQNGLYCRPTGQANTPVGNSMLVIKRVTNSEAPNNGVVLEFGNSTSWTGQLYIGDNATQGIYYNGWSNGVRGSWIRLASQNDLPQDTDWLSLTPSMGTWSSLRYRKIGKLVQITGYASSLTVSNGVVGTIATLPSGYRPSVHQYGIATGVSGWTGRANVNASNGIIYMDACKGTSGAYNGTGYAAFNIMYFID